MRAWQYLQPGGKIEDILFLNNSAQDPPKTPAEDEILVKVISAAINPVDYKVAESALWNKSMFIKMPATPGLDYCGRIVSTGSGVDSLVNGTLVFGRLSDIAQQGTLGEYILAHAPGCVPVPDGVSPDEAAAIGTAGMTAWQCVHPNVTSGSRVFINGGSGGTGLYGIQIAKQLGCHVTTSCSTNNVPLVKDAGADAVINYSSNNVTQTLIAGGLVYDLIVDNVGSPADLYESSHLFLKEAGKYVQIGAAPNLGSFGKLMTRRMLPTFLGGGKRAFQFLRCKNDAAAYAQIARWISEGKVKAHINSTYSLNDVQKAFAKLKTGRCTGKIVVHVTEAQETK